MKTLIQFILITSTLLPLSAFPLQKAKPLTEEELLPFCNNKQIWSNFSIPPARCLEASVTCSNEIAAKNLDWMKASKELYPCVFKKLGINLPNE
jgi:hypothetical protein